MKWTRVTVLLCALAVLFGCSSVKQQTPPQKLKVALGYIENIQFAPFYVAQSLGYFSEQGIGEVEFIHGYSPDILANIATGAYDIALADGDEIIKAQAKEQPLQPFFGFYQTFPVTLISLATTPLQSLKDITGKKIGIPGAFGASFDGLRIALQQAGIEQKSFTLMPVGYTQIEQLLQGNIDIAVGYSNNEPIQLATLKKTYSTLPLAPFADLVPATLVTNTAFASKNTSLLQKFTTALKKAMVFCATSPEEATTIAFTKGFIPQLQENAQEKALPILQESIKLWGKQSQFGEINQARWEKSKELLKNIGALQ